MKLHWEEFDQYLLVLLLPMLHLNVKWSNAKLYNPLPNELNCDCRSVPTIHCRDLLEWVEVTQVAAILVEACVADW